MREKMALRPEVKYGSHCIYFRGNYNYVTVVSEDLLYQIESRLVKKCGIYG